MGKFVGTCSFYHQPVMVSEVLEVLEGVPAGTILDATLGGGGHSEAILDFRSDIEVIAIDSDESALIAARMRLERFGKRIVLEKSNFVNFESVLDKYGIEVLAGFLFDLGVSSAQIAQPERGFSYKNVGPLDMRMDQSQKKIAFDIVNGSKVEDLSKLLQRNSQERYAKRIALAVVHNRPISDTGELAEIVKSAIPAAARRRGGHPAKRTFQAIRIEVNSELTVLESSFREAIKRLVPGGRGMALSYHSGEDRIVKNSIREAVSGGCICPAHLPCSCGSKSLASARSKSIRPSELEISSNSRAKSARLRFLERK